MGTSLGAAAAATWIFRGDGSRRRRGCHVDIPWGRVAAAATCIEVAILAGKIAANWDPSLIFAQLLTDALDPPPKAAALERVDDVRRRVDDVGRRVRRRVAARRAAQRGARARSRRGAEGCAATGYECKEHAVLDQQSHQVWRSLNGKRVLEIVKSDAQAACAACAARA